MQLIEIEYLKLAFGFSKPEKETFPGAQFDNGKIAYLKDDVIYVAESREKLEKELLSVSIKVL